MTKIRGFAIRGALRYVKHRGGAGAVREILAGLPSASAEVFEKKIRHASWYPYTAYSELLAAIDRDLGRGDHSLMRDIGLFAARHEGDAPFEFLTRLASIEGLLGSTVVVWQNYCDTGRFEASELGPGVAIGALHGFPEISIDHCHLLAGWISGIGRAAGAREGKVRKSKCVHRGDDCCEYSCRWK